MYRLLVVPLSYRIPRRSGHGNRVQNRRRLGHATAASRISQMWKLLRERIGVDVEFPRRWTGVRKRQRVRRSKRRFGQGQ